MGWYYFVFTVDAHVKNIYKKNKCKLKKKVSRKTNMINKTIRNFEIALYNNQIKKLQVEVDYLRNIKTKDANDRLCDILRKYSKYSKFKSINLLDLRNCQLENSNLEKLSLRRVCFWNSSLKNSLFKGASLIEVDFWNADLSNSDISDADLTSSVLTYVNLENSDLSRSNLKNVSLSEANLLNADLSGSNLKWAKLDLFQLKKVRSLENAVMPDGTIYSREWENIIRNENIPDKFNE